MLRGKLKARIEIIRMSYTEFPDYALVRSCRTWATHLSVIELQEH